MRLRSDPPLNAAHICHAKGCARPITASLLMCSPHWHKVPSSIQKAVYKHYRNPGQQKQYVDAVRAAIQSVAEQEGLA